MRKELQDQIDPLIRLLAEGRFDSVEEVTNGVRLAASDIKNALGRYGRTLVYPPSEAYELMDVIEVRSAGQRRWSIAMPLWTKEEGRSDLSIEVTIIRKAGEFVLELDDIRVL